jgi:hypothetical protein
MAMGGPGDRAGAVEAAKMRNKRFRKVLRLSEAVVCRWRRRPGLGAMGVKKVARPGGEKPVLALDAALWGGYDPGVLSLPCSDSKGSRGP